MKLKNLFIISILISHLSKATITPNEPMSSGVGFIENKGQIIDQYGKPNTGCLYLFNSNGLNIQLRKTGFSYDAYSIQESGKVFKINHGKKSDDENAVVNFHRIDIDLLDCNTNAIVEGNNQATDYFNYYTNGSVAEYVHHFFKVNYKNIYNNIDLEFIVVDGKPKYNFIVRKGGNLRDVKLKYSGASKLSLNKQSEIEIETSLGLIKENIPLSYEEDTQNLVTVNYKIEGNIISFVSSTYDLTKTLVIDPTPNRIFGTYFGGGSNEFPNAVVTDASGNIYVGGEAFGSGIATAGSFLTSGFGFDRCSFAAKFDASGNRTWGTYCGALGKNTYGYSLAAGNSGNVYLVGSTQVTTLGTAGSFKPTSTGGEGYLLKFKQTGTRVWGTYFGNVNSEVRDVVVNAAENIYITGMVQDYTNITTPGAYQTLGQVGDAYVEKFDSSCVRIWGTLYGGPDQDHAYAIDLDTSNNVLIGGNTISNSGIASPGAYQTAFVGPSSNGDAFVAKISSDGQNRLWGTYYGGSGYEEIWDLCVLPSGDVVVGGELSNVASGIASPGAQQPAPGGVNDGFVAMISFNGNSRVWGTYYGGVQSDYVFGVACNAANDIFVIGNTLSTINIASSGAYQPALSGTQDAMFAKYNTSGVMQWGTYYGGSSIEIGRDITCNPSGNPIIVGRTNTAGTAPNAIATTGCFQPTLGGGYDIFIAQFDGATALTSSFTPSATNICETNCINFTDNSIGSPTSWSWTFSGASVTTSTVQNPTGICYSSAGAYSLSLTVSDGTNFSTSSQTITVNSIPPTPAVINGSTTICQGSSNTYSIAPVPGATSYTWTLPGGWSGTSTTNTINTTASSTGGNISITATNACGTSSSQTISVTVNTIPSISGTISGLTSLCTSTSASTYSIAAIAGASSYAWSLPVGWSGSSATNIISASPGSTGVFSVTASNACGTSAIKTLSVTVNTLPTVTASASPSATLCAGSSLTLSGGGASTYTWSGGITNAVAFTPTVSATYTVTGTDVNGCSNITTKAITVNPLPAVTAGASPSSTVCTGSNLTLSGSGAATYTWTGGVTNAIAFTPTVSATYTVTGTDANGCANIATKAVTVNNLPSVIANVMPTATVCVGTSILLFGGGASTYTWSSGVTNNVAFTPTVSATYTVTGTDANGCNNAATKAITVNSLPTVTANASPSATLCAGSSLTLSGGGASSYTWSGGITNAVAFTPSVSATYTITGTDANGCSNTAIKAITVNNLPIVIANVMPTATVCTGTSILLFGGGASTYTWSSGVTNNIAFTPTVSATYTVTGTDANGCNNIATKAITVNPLPTILAGALPSATLCLGSNLTLSGGGGSTYTWSGGITDAVAFTPTVSATYTVTGTDANGCNNIATQVITINNLPIVITSASPSATVCSGSNLTLSGAGASTYTWSGGVTDAVAFTPTVSATYTVTGTDVNGCVNSVTEVITVNNLPAITISTSPSATVCAGSSLTLSGVGASTYAWSNGITDAVAFTPTLSATYTVTGTDANGCNNTASQAITVNTLPNVTLSATSNTLCINDTPIGLTGSPSGGTYSGTGVIGSNFDPTVSGAGTFTLSYTYTDVNNCSNIGTTLISVGACTGLSQVPSSLLQISVFPNPFSSIITINYPLLEGADGGIEVLNLLGEKVYSATCSTTKTEINLTNSQPGVYFIKITINNKSVIEKIIKQ